MCGCQSSVLGRPAWHCCVQGQDVLMACGMQAESSQQQGRNTSSQQDPVAAEGEGTAAAAAPLPRGLLLLDRRGKGVRWCSSHELNALNSRLADASHDCLVLTQQVRSPASGQPS